MGRGREIEREREIERKREKEKGGIWRLYYWNSISKSKWLGSKVENLLLEK